MRSFCMILLLILLLVSCMKNPSGLPDQLGYDGLIVQGWNSFITGEFQEALEYFQQAMSVDLNRPDAFLGAGIASIHLEGYHEDARGFLQEAVQLDQGHSAVSISVDRTVTQDTLWTVVQCIDDDLPPDSLGKWLWFTADSGLVWVGNSIRNYLVSNGLSTDLSFRLQPEAIELAACIELYNMQNGEFYCADSISDGFAYFTVPMTATSQGPGNFYFQWIMADQGVLFDTAELSIEEPPGQTTLDAIAARVSLEAAMGEEGDLLQAVACTQGLLWKASDYRFGEGDSLLESVFQTETRHVVACCCSFAFNRGKFIYSWFLCRQAGYGLELDPESVSFLLDLLCVIQEMAGS